MELFLGSNKKQHIACIVWTALFDLNEFKRNKFYIILETFHLNSHIFVKAGRPSKVIRTNKTMAVIILVAEHLPVRDIARGL